MITGTSNGKSIRLYLYKDKQFLRRIPPDYWLKKDFNKWYYLCFIWLYFTGVQAQDRQGTPVKDSIPEHIRYFEAANKEIDSLRYDAAIKLFKKAIKKKKDYWEAYQRSAFAKYKKADYKGAIEDLEHAEKLTNWMFDIYKLKGMVYYANKDFKNAKKFLDTAVTISVDDNIEDAEVYYYQALLMYAGKSYKQALTSCEHALEYDAKYVEPMLLKGEVRFAMKDYNYAIKELNLAIVAMSNKIDYKAYYYRAKSKFEIGDYKGAIADWNVYIDNTKKTEEVLISRAAAKINAGDNSGAIVDLDEAIVMNPKNPVSYCYRGVAKGGNKMLDAAIKDLDYSIKLKFDYSTAYVNRAAIKMAKKDKKGACEDLEKADGLGNELAIRLIEQYCKH